MKALVEKRGAERVPQLADASTAAADDEVALVDVPGRRNVWLRKQGWG